ncbi:helix-turn-helix domain-containing protein [Phycicoccus duodecadis]|uniref:Excisionase family DNA binding protein n=1 Tax=Phycicoccus duodecadis TaxID=173053 RepID=A0A2N3YF07_9MICO|nr:helix-turn-helix domain-containing protein [Phycicoccus duodecadis]PKW25406.1 excisionase family DNA binding protein [Phycicoccus duodecadis]
MSDLDDLLRGPVALAVTRVLIRDLTVQRRNGQPVPPWAPALLDALVRAGGERVDVDRFASETRRGTVGPVLMSETRAPEAADQTGVSVQYVRKLARSGRIRCRRVGRDWLIDVDSLRNVLGRAS